MTFTHFYHDQSTSLRSKLEFSSVIWATKQRNAWLFVVAGEKIVQVLMWEPTMTGWAKMATMWDLFSSTTRSVHCTLLTRDCVWLQVTGHAPLNTFLSANATENWNMIRTWLYEPSHDITGGSANLCLWVVCEASANKVFDCSALQQALKDFEMSRIDVPRTVVLMSDGA